MILLEDSGGPDQTAKMRRLIWAFTVHIFFKTFLYGVAHIIIRSNRQSTFFETESIGVILISPQTPMPWVLIGSALKCLAETLLMNTHRMFSWRKKKTLCGYPILSGAVNKYLEEG